MPQTVEAIKYLAWVEGVSIHKPCIPGKALKGMLAMIKNSEVGDTDGEVLFVHTHRKANGIERL
jgi:1-aminocyclopropane-1-carboxylate deaminase/D-cysteine desulfhydrase-like pyridoxal-dependent ACC family enzyme